MNEICKECGAKCCKDVRVPVKMDLDPDTLEFLNTRGRVLGAFWIIPARCKFLDKRNRCRIYARRPRQCREFEVDGEACKYTRDTA